MLEKITYLQDEILRAPPEVMVPAAIFLFVVLIGLVLGLRGHTRTVEQHGLEAEARRWIGDQIDEHIDVLAEAYRKARAPAAHEELPPGFVSTIETFIAEVLLRKRDAEDSDLDLVEAVREFVVLHRPELYEDVTSRTREFLTAT
jgi:hypothetical protein